MICAQDGGTSPNPAAYSREQVSEAVNAGADLVRDDLEVDGRDVDLINLIVNTALTLLDEPGLSLDDVIKRCYETEPAEVRGWWSGWSRTGTQRGRAGSSCCCAMTASRQPPACSPSARTAAPRPSITPACACGTAQTHASGAGARPRLHEVSRASVEPLLPTVGENGEGLWFLHWPDGQRGPYPSEQAAWDAWQASPVSPQPPKHADTRKPGRPTFPRGQPAALNPAPAPAPAGSGAAMLHAQRLAQAENSPRIGQPLRNPGIADMDPGEVLAAARHEAAKVHQTVNDNGDLREPARALAEQFRRAGRAAV